MKTNRIFFATGQATVQILISAFFLFFETKINAQSPCPGTGYCEANQYAYGCAASPVNIFTFNTINNSNSGCNATPPTSSYCAAMNTTVNAGSSYTMTMQTLAPWAASFGVWIDYNQNGSFADPGEFVYASPSNTSSLYTTSVAIPLTALSGLTRLRVRSNNAPTPLFNAGMSCTQLNYGETEDYGVYICTSTSAPATPGPIAGPNDVCANSTVTYSIATVTGASIYNWVVPAGAVINTGQGSTTISVTWSVAGGNVTVNAGNCFGTSAVQTLTVTLSTAAPTAPGSITGSSSVCSGGSSGYSIAAVAGAASYNWTVPSGSTITSGQGSVSINVNFGNNSGNISVTATNGCGASAASTLAVTVSPPPTFTGLAANYCVSSPPATLTGSPSGGTFSGPGISGSTFSPAIAGAGTHTIEYFTCSPSYSVTQTGTFSPVPGSGTTVFLSDDVVSGVLPIGFSFSFYCNAYTSFYICSNGFLTFNSASTASYPGQMLPNNDPSTANMIAFCWNDLNPGAGGTVQYFTTGTMPNRKLVVNFNNVPYFSGGSPITSQVVLYETSNFIEIHTTAVSGNSNTQTMGVENAAGTTATTVPGRNGVVWSANNDYVKFSPVAGCITTQTTTVSPPPVLTITPASDSICPGNSSMLSVSGADTYSWSPASGLNTTTGANVTASPSATTTYTVTGTSVGGCTGTSSVTITVNPAPPAPTITPDGPTTFCQGGNVQLTSSSATEYLWSDNSTTQSISVNMSGNYSVTISDVSGCSAISAPVIITVNTLPIADAGMDVLICLNGSTVLNAGGGLTYFWSPSTGLSDVNSATPVANPTITTVYTVTVTDANGCSANDDVTVTVDPCLGINAAGGSMGIKIFPNPSNGIINISVDNPAADKLEIEITTVQGQAVYKGIIRKPEGNQIDISMLAKGIYFLKVSGGNEINVRKIILE